MLDITTAILLTMYIISFFVSICCKFDDYLVKQLCHHNSPGRRIEIEANITKTRREEREGKGRKEIQGNIKEEGERETEKRSDRGCIDPSLYQFNDTMAVFP